MLLTYFHSAIASNTHLPSGIYLFGVFVPVSFVSQSFLFLLGRSLSFHYISCSKRLVFQCLARDRLVPASPPATFLFCYHLTYIMNAPLASACIRSPSSPLCLYLLWSKIGLDLEIIFFMGFRMVKQNSEMRWWIPRSMVSPSPSSATLLHS